MQRDTERIEGGRHEDKLITRTYQSSTNTGSNLLINRTAGFRIGVSADADQDDDVTYGYNSPRRLTTANDGESFTYGFLADSHLIETLTSSLHVTTRPDFLLFGQRRSS